MVRNNPLKGYFNIHHRKYKFSLILLFLSLTVSILLLTGCVRFYDPEASQEYNTDIIGSVTEQSIIGQTFTSRRPSLNGITIWITIPSVNITGVEGSTEYLSVALFHTVNETTPFYTTTISLPSSGRTIPINIIFPSIGNSPQENYYLQLSKPPGTIQINGRSEDAYPYGQAYLNQSPIDADIAFRLSYDYGFSDLTQDLSSGLRSIWILLPLFAVVYLPGWLLLDISKLRKRFDSGEQTAISIGISLSIIPILMLWTSILKISWSRNGLLLLSGALTFVFLFRLVKNFFARRKVIDFPDDRSQKCPLLVHNNNEHTNLISTLLLSLIFITTLAIRMIMVRDLATPAWVDSIHHALITKLILDNGAFPQNYLPYLDISPAEYHPGFHSIAAAFIWLSKLNIEQSLLILGQVLNALSIFSVYLFSKTIIRSSSVGLFAALITGFLTPMPAYYTSWGRYTELTGLLILSSVFVFIKLARGNLTIWEKAWVIFIISITSAGLFMVHYRVLVFLSLLIIVYLFVYFSAKPQDQTYHFYQMFLLILISVALSILLVLPWFIQTIRSALIPILSLPIKSNIPLFQDFSWAYLNSAFGKQSLVLAGLGLLWGLVRSKRFSILILIWVVLLFISANLGALHMPGAGLVSNLSVEIMLFIPISILGGYFINRIVKHWIFILPAKIKFPFLGMTIVFFGWVSFLGAKQLLTIINPVTILSRNTDMPAIEWVRNNVPVGEKIIINPFPWGYGLYAGSDGGYWITPLSGRQTLPPAVLYGLGEENKEISDQAQNIINLSSNPEGLSDFMLANRYRYIYIGAKGGVLSPQKLLSSNLFTLIYYREGVWIFSRKP